MPMPSASPRTTRNGNGRALSSRLRRHFFPCRLPENITRSLRVNWLQVFKRAHTALLGSGGGPEHRTCLVPSEKCAGGWGSNDNEMRMITASFFRAIEQFAGDLCLHFLPRFQKVVAIRKTCNQLMNMHVLHQAVEEDLPRVERGALDGSAVAANASRRRLLNAERLQQRVPQLRAVRHDDAQGETPAEVPAWMAKTPRSRTAQHERYRQAQEHLAGLQAATQHSSPSER